MTKLFSNKPLVVEAIWNKVAGIAGRSLEVRLPNPVRPGTTLTGQSQIQAITLRPEKRNAVVILAIDPLAAIIE